MLCPQTFTWQAPSHHPALNCYCPRALPDKPLPQTLFIRPFNYSIYFTVFITIENYFIHFFAYTIDVCLEYHVYEKTDPCLFCSSLRPLELEKSVTQYIYLWNDFMNYHPSFKTEYILEKTEVMVVRMKAEYHIENQLRNG